MKLTTLLPYLSQESKDNLDMMNKLGVELGQVVSDPRINSFSPLKEEEEGGVNVGGYQTQHFDVCPGATALYKDIESKGVDMDLASRTAKLQDVLFFIEKHVEEEGYDPNPYYGEIAQILGDQIMTMAGMMDLGSEHSYIQGHIDRIQSAVQKSSVNEVKTYKKGDKLKIKLKNGKKFDVVFDSYSRTKGVALGKFKDGSGEYDTKPFDLDAIVESVNEAKNIKVTFRSIAAKNKWMKNQKLKSTDKAVVSQGKSSLVLTPDMKDYVSKTNHKDLIYQVDMVNEASDIKSGAVKMSSLVKDLEKELPKRISGNKKGILPPLGYGEPNYINFPEHIAMILKKNGVSIEVDEFDKLVKTVFRNLKPKLTKTPNLIPSVGNTKLVHKKHKLDETVNEETLQEAPTKRSNEFFNNSKHGKAIYKLLGGRPFRASAVKKYLDTIIDKLGNQRGIRVWDFIGKDLGLDVRKYGAQPVRKYEFALLQAIDDLYHIHIKESVDEANAVSGGKIHKFITGKNLTYKGKKYSDIEFELLGIDNKDKLVKLKIIAPRNLFGQEMKVPFKTIRRGPFIKTDTSK